MTFSVWRLPERAVLQPIIFEHTAVLWSRISRTVIGTSQSMGGLVMHNPVSKLLRVPDESMSGIELRYGALPLPTSAAEGMRGPL